MRYFKPRFIPGWLCEVQDRPLDKLGGLPWGLPETRWPVCAACKKPQSLVMQFYHHPDHLDLGGPGNALFAFQCADWWESESACEPFSFESGSTSCFVLKAQELTSGLSNPPMPCSLHTESRVTDWIKCEDSVEAHQEHDFLTDEGWMRLNQRTYSGTKIGSIPFCIRGSLRLPSIPNVKWHFVAQADQWVTIECSPPDPDIAGCKIVRLKGDGSVLAEDRAKTIRNDGPGTIWHEVDKNEWNFIFANFSQGLGHAFLSENLRDGCFAFSS